MDDLEFFLERRCFTACRIPRLPFFGSRVLPRLSWTASRRFPRAFAFSCDKEQTENRRSTGCNNGTVGFQEDQGGVAHEIWQAHHGFRRNLLCDVSKGMFRLCPIMTIHLRDLTIFNRSSKNIRASSRNMEISGMYRFILGHSPKDFCVFS